MYQYKYIILCLCVSLCAVYCNLDKKEGADCVWEGVRGKCVEETRCLTTLDVKTESKQPVCSKHGEVTIICCTDCDLVNDTRNVVFSPSGGLLWKDGTPARDNCLQYLDTLPYECRQGGFYSGLKRNLYEEKNCHNFHLWAIGGAPPPGSKPGAEYPHQVILGYGKILETAKWTAGGSVISDRYILTSADAVSSQNYGEVKFVAMDVQNRSDPSSWQTNKVKRIILHPEYSRPSKYNDIALIETETPIKFNKNVLPACLHVEESEDEQAIGTTWNDLREDTIYPPQIVDKIQTINLEKFSKEECLSAYEGKENIELEGGINFTTQMCYGSKKNPAHACRGTVGEPLLIGTQFSRCIPAIIGVSSFWRPDCGPKDPVPAIYTRVSPYVPWISSVVWP